MVKLAGLVFDSTATMLRLTFEDERTVALRFVYVSPPVDAGLFAYNPTPAEQRVGHRPLNLALLDGRGNTVARTEIDWQNGDRKAREVFRDLPPPRRP